MRKGVSMKRDVLVTSLVKQKPVQTPVVDRSADGLARLEHLESQMAKLSELVREHAEDVDRLVRIVAEDRDVIRRQLLRKHQEQVRVRKHLPDSNSKEGLDFYHGAEKFRELRSRIVQTLNVPIEAPWRQSNYPLACERSDRFKRSLVCTSSALH